MIVDTTQLNHRKHGNGGYEESFYKMFYQLLMHKFLKKYYDKDKDTRFIICMDERTTSYKLNDLKTILNSGIKKELSLPYECNPIRTVEPRNSKNSEVIQINDLIIGAIGFQKNGNHLLAGSRRAKIELAEYVAKSAGLLNLQNDTRWGQHRFEIWNINFRK
ncbi:MAG: DUF3800 domain-containing protein [Bacteroidetes bacterium]|nr:DUF3800 domain-containing protein [Bacteroidota bacterium]